MSRRFPALLLFGVCDPYGGISMVMTTSPKRRVIINLLRERFQRMDISHSPFCEIAPALTSRGVSAV